MTKKISKKYYIEDWTGKRFDYGPFETFQDGWDFIFENFSEDEFDEFYVFSYEEGF